MRHRRDEHDRAGCKNRWQREDPAAEKQSYYYDGIIEHMHRHADQIDIINDALADDDLDASKVPARWLWRHETMLDVPDDWQPYLFAMRQAARDLGSATDLATARAAAKRITEQCQDCHVYCWNRDQWRGARGRVTPKSPCSKLANMSNTQIPTPLRAHSTSASQR